MSCIHVFHSSIRLFAALRGAEEDVKVIEQSKSPLDHSGDVKDISNATTFLFSPAAEWIMGQVIV